MVDQRVVFVDNLGNDFDIGVIEAGVIRLKIDSTLTRQADGTIGLAGGAVTVVSATAGNLITEDTGAFIDAGVITANETAWQGADAGGFLTVTPGGTNGHNVAFGVDWTNAAFKEAVQDAVGESIAAGIGLSYDDALDAITANFGNLTFGDGLNYVAGTQTVTVKPDPASPSTVAVTAAGLSVTPLPSADAGNLVVPGADSKLAVTPLSVQNAAIAAATVNVQDAFGVNMHKAFPA